MDGACNQDGKETDIEQQDWGVGKKEKSQMIDGRMCLKKYNILFSILLFISEQCFPFY